MKPQKSARTKKGLACSEAKPETQKTEFETEKLQGKGTKKIPYLTNVPQLQPPKPNIIFHLFNRHAKSGISTVLAHVHYEKKRAIFSTKIQGNTAHWNEQEHQFVGKNYTYHNNRLAEIDQDIYAIYKELLAQKIQPSATMLKKIYTQKIAHPTILAVIEDYFKKIYALFEAQQIKIARVKQLKTHLAHIKNFLIQQNQADFLIKNVKQRFNTDFYEYMLLTRKVSKSYIRKVFFTVKSLFEFAVEKEFIQSNPYKAPKIKLEDKPLVFLNVNELQKLKAFRSDTMRLQRAADLFLFQCYTGFCYADMQSFDMNTDTQVLESGAIWILKERQKTGTLTRVPLFPEAFAILQKYNGQLPKIKNHRYNLEIKEVAKLANIDKYLTTHIARKTAGFLWLNSGLLSYKEVSPMLGHKSVLVTEKNYAKVLTNTIEHKILETKIYTFVLEKEFNHFLALSQAKEQLEIALKPIN